MQRAWQLREIDPDRRIFPHVGKAMAQELVAYTRWLVEGPMTQRKGTPNARARAITHSIRSSNISDATWVRGTRFHPQKGCLPRTREDPARRVPHTEGAGARRYPSARLASFAHARDSGDTSRTMALNSLNT